MKHLREYNNWVTDVTGNVNVNYGDKKPKLSDVVIEVIKFIEDNYDKIDDSLNGTSDSHIDFYNKLEFEDISIGVEDQAESINTNKIPYIHFLYRDVRDSLRGYRYDITNYDYEYLKDYFYKIYREFRKKQQEGHKEEYKSELQKIEDKKMKDLAKKMNI